jgi:lysozyme
MRTSSRGVDFIKAFESLHDGDLSTIGLQPKLDPRQIWTSGWGSLVLDDKGRKIIGKENKDKAYKFNTIHTIEDADNQLANDLRAFEIYVNNKLTKCVNQNQFDALISHTYNTGGSDTLFGLINKDATEQKIRSWWERTYITSRGVRLRGLVRRRKEEADMYFENNTQQ